MLFHLFSAGVGKNIIWLRHALAAIHIKEAKFEFRQIMTS